jgi:hypothetical protein
MLKKLKILLVFFSLSLQGWAQIDTLIKVPHDFFELDNLGNVYVVQQNEITKFNDKGSKFDYKFSNKLFGNIQSIDATNALKIQVFYKDLGVLLFLDNMLAENGEALRLQLLDLEQSLVSCFSYNNGIWFYNPINFTLTRLNDRLQKEIVTGNLNQITARKINPKSIKEIGKYLYITQMDGDVIQLDLAGNYIKTYHGFGAVEVFITETGFYYLLNNQLYFYHFKKLDAQLLVNFSDYKENFRIINNKLYFSDKKHILKFDLPKVN